MNKILPLTLIFCLMIFPAFSRADTGVQVLTAVGGSLHGVVLDGNEALLAEGESIIRVPLLGPNAYQVTERLYLRQQILDLVRHPDGSSLLALTDQGVFSLSADGRAILDFLPGSGQSLRVYGDRVLILAQAGGVRVLQIMPDGKLAADHFLDTPGSAYDAALSERGWLAVADGITGLRLYQRGNFNVMGALPEISPAVKVEAAETRLYVATEHHLAIVDAVQPQNPRLVGHYAPIQAARRAVLVNQWAVLADEADGLKVYSTQPPAYQNGEIHRPSMDVHLVNNALISASIDGLHVYDPARLPELVEVNYLPLPAPPTALASNTTLLVVAMGERGLSFVNLNNFSWMGSTPIRGEITDLALHGQNAYLTLRDGRLLALDLTTPTSPRTLATLELSGDPIDISIWGDQALVAAGIGGFSLISLQNPPRLTSQIPAREFAHAAVLTDTYRLLQDGDQLRVFDARGSDIGNYPAPGGGMTVGNGLILAVGMNQLSVFSAADFTRLGDYTAPLDFTGLQALTGQAIITSRSPQASYVRLDTNDPQHPREIEIRAMPGAIEKFALRGDDLLAINTTGLFNHWRVPPQGTSTLAGEYQAPDNISALAAQGNSLLLLGNQPHLLQSGQLHALNIAPAISAAWVGGIYAILEENGNLSLYNVAGERLQHYPGLAATTLTAASDSWWVTTRDGKLLHLLPNQPEPINAATLNAAFTALAWSEGVLYMGTQDGRIWGWQNGSVITDEISLGREISAIQPLKDGTLAVAAGRDGLWLLDRQLNTLQHLTLAGEILALEQHPQDEWLAVASGLCGLRVLSYPDWREVARYQAGIVTDVAVTDEALWVVRGEMAEALHIEPTSPGSNLTQPFAPIPADQEILSSPISELRWLPTPTACDPIRYELSINGQTVTTLDQPLYRPAQPLIGSVHWQVTLIDSSGNRASSTEWRFTSTEEGWLSTPQAFAAEPEPTSRQTAAGIDLLWFGLGIIGVGLGGLFFLWRRWK